MFMLWKKLDLMRMRPREPATHIAEFLLENTEGHYQDYQRPLCDFNCRHCSITRVQEDAGADKSDLASHIDI